MSKPAARYPIELSVSLFPLESDESFTGTSRNISETGILIAAERGPPSGALVQLKFPEFEWTAEVVWTRNMEKELRVLLGMRFLGLSDEDRKLLSDLIKRAAGR